MDERDSKNIAIIASAMTVISNGVELPTSEMIDGISSTIRLWLENPQGDQRVAIVRELQLMLLDLHTTDAVSMLRQLTFISYSREATQEKAIEAKRLEKNLSIIGRVILITATDEGLGEQTGEAMAILLPQWSRVLTSSTEGELDNYLGSLKALVNQMRPKAAKSEALELLKKLDV